MRMLDRCRTMWLRRERGPCFLFTFPVPAEAFTIAVAVADDSPILRHGWLVPYDIEEAAVGQILADRKWLDRMSERPRTEAMQCYWMLAVSQG